LSNLTWSSPEHSTGGTFATAIEIGSVVDSTSGRAGREVELGVVAGEEGTDLKAKNPAIRISPVAVHRHFMSSRPDLRFEIRDLEEYP
jgi:hypothetical protein